MGTLTRADYSRGWVPSADAVHAPPNALLRGDNLTLDQRGVLGLRAGSAKINSSAFADTDIHSLFTVNLSGTRYRMAGAAAAVYANGSSVSSGFAGSGDIAFGSYLDQILMARSTTKRKYDGTTVRTWGIAAPNAAPTAAAIAQDGKTFATFNSADAEFTWNEDDGTGAAYDAGYDSTANGAAVLNPDAETGRGRITKTFGSPTDFTTYDGAQTGLDSDLISFYVKIAEPQYVERISLQIDFNDAAFINDQYFYTWFFNERDDEGHLIPGTSVPSVGWNLLTVTRGDMRRYANATAGKNWSTVKAVRLEVLNSVGGADGQYQFDLLRIRGGSSSPLTGLQRYRLVAVRNTGTYFGKSAPSDASADIEVTAQGVQLTVAAGVISALDTQVNELWVYRYSETLGDYYRSKVHTGGPWVGAQTINDTASNESVLTTNMRLEATNTTPPDSIIGIVGPHYDRILCLTATHVYPSQPRNLDSFDSLQVIRVGDASETAYWIATVREEVYVGTSKDIYRLSGDWTARADGLVNVDKKGLGIGAPPISPAFVQDGDTIIYLASDGWRQIGAEVPLTSGDVDLLYRGKTRHGVSPVNIATGRFKAAITQGRFSAITPEGASTTSSTVLHRYVPALQRWERHTYGRNWRCLYREPDGTLIASDDAGFVWTLDTGTQDDGTDIPVVLWTPVEDNGQPNQRKDPWELSVRATTGSATAAVALHLDGAGAGSHSTSMNVSSTGLTPVATSLDGIAVFRQAQLRVTGSFSTFLWYDYTLTYRERPALLTFAEPKPEVRGTRRKRFAGFTLILDTLGDAATVTPVIDDVAQTAQSVTASDAVSTPVTFANVVGRDLWAKISKSTGFEFYGLEPIVVAEMPPPVIGRLPDSNGGHVGPKLVSGIRLRACTLGVARTITPILDGVNQTAVTFTTDADEPDELSTNFAAPQIATDIAFSVDGRLELYNWSPIVDHALPMQRTLWDTGPIDLGTRAVWIPRFVFKAKLTEDVTVTPYVDDVAQTAVTIPAKANDPITTYDVPLARAVRGRVLRFRLTSGGYFYPYWIEPWHRVTGGETDLRKTRVAVGA